MHPSLADPLKKRVYFAHGHGYGTIRFVGTGRQDMGFVRLRDPVTEALRKTFHRTPLLCFEPACVRFPHQGGRHDYGEEWHSARKSDAG